MKKLVWLAMVAGVAATAYGQGQVNMNTAAGNAYVRFSNTVAHAWGDATFHVGLYWAADAATLQAGGGELITTGGTTGNGWATFGTGGAAGYVTAASGGGNRTIPTTTLTYFQLRAWTGNYANYEAAATSGDGSVLISLLTAGAFGSPIASATPAVSPTPVPQIPWAPGSLSTAPLVVNLVPVPEPSTLALAGLGLMGLILIRRRK